MTSPERPGGDHDIERRQNHADGVAQHENRGPSARVCAHCGVAFIAQHGNRKYHPECTAKARAEKARGYSRAYRAAQREPDTVQPAPEYANGVVRARGVALSGQRVLELRAALWPLMLLTMQNHQHLMQYTTQQMRKPRERQRLRTLVDEARLVLDLLHELLPEIELDLDMADAELATRASQRGMTVKQMLELRKMRILWNTQAQELHRAEQEAQKERRDAVKTRRTALRGESKT